MRWKLTLQFIFAILIIAVAASFISAAVTSYYYYVSSNVLSSTNMIVSFSPNTLDVKKLAALVIVAEKKPALYQDAQDMLKKSGSWMQVIDSNGNEIKSYNKPQYVKASYTTEDIEELKENSGMYKGYTTTVINQIAKVQIDKEEIDKENTTKEQSLKGQMAAGQSPIVTFLLGVPKPKITVFTILYSAFSYLTEWNNPKSGPKIVSLLLTLPVILLLGYLFATKLAKPAVNVIINWERSGLLDVPRSKNGYRVYGEDEIKLLRVIKALRQENYSTQCIGWMLKKLKTENKGNNMFLSEETEDWDDSLLSSLSEAECDVKELIDYIGKLISKKQKFKEV